MASLIEAVTTDESTDEHQYNDATTNRQDTDIITGLREALSELEFPAC